MYGCDQWLMLSFVCYHLGFYCLHPFLDSRQTLEQLLAAGYPFWWRASEGEHAYLLLAPSDSREAREGRFSSVLCFRPLSKSVLIPGT